MPTKPSCNRQAVRSAAVPSNAGLLRHIELAAHFNARVSGWSKTCYLQGNVPDPKNK